MAKAEDLFPLELVAGEAVRPDQEAQEVRAEGEEEVQGRKWKRPAGVQQHGLHCLDHPGISAPAVGAEGLPLMTCLFLAALPLVLQVAQRGWSLELYEPMEVEMRQPWHEQPPQQPDAPSFADSALLPGWS